MLKLRITFKDVGNELHAYMAQLDTMDGATLLGTALLENVAYDPLARANFVEAVQKEFVSIMEQNGYSVRRA